ncbi:MAG: ATP-dependent DNA helicase PcrA [Chloroflexi bacterium]|nr:MAG: ATP-dependent DNA helicase PcrA [Chloroflexota bacterium]
MRERIERLVGERARWITIGTFHAFCARTLRQYGAEIGIDPRFVIYDDADQLAVVKQALESLNINVKQFSPRAVLSQISKAKSSGIDPEAYRESVESYWEEIVARVYPNYQAALALRKALDFDDLLDRTVHLLREAPQAAHALRNRHRYILVDEYQDTNRVQYTLVRELGREHRNVCVVGDPDQSIYGWRAADIRNILTFREDYPDAAEIHLEENYRSTPQILAAADAVIRANLQRIDRSLRTSNTSGPLISLRECFDEGHEARVVVEEISRLQSEGFARGADFAVLYRTNAQSRPLEEMFIRAGIPYQLIGGTRFYERKEIKDALALLRLVANPDDASAFGRAIAETPLGDGIGAKTVRDIDLWMETHQQPLSVALANVGMEGGPPIAARAAKLLKGVSETLTFLREQSDELTLPELFDLTVERTGFRATFSTGDPTLADRWENVLQLRGHMEAYDALPAEERLTTFLEEVALVSDADTIEDDRDRVTLITLHAVKGLEFPIVFITGVEEGLIPHQRSISEQPEMIEEERRLFYVGITRAMHRLYLTYTATRSRFGSAAPALPSSFLNAIPHDVLEPLPGRQNMRRERLWETRPTAPTAMPIAPPVVRFLSGQSVFHTRFGEGTIVEVRDQADDQELTVAFSRHGTKRLVASLANLTVIS